MDGKRTGQGGRFGPASTTTTLSAGRSGRSATATAVSERGSERAFLGAFLCAVCLSCARCVEEGGVYGAGWVVNARGRLAGDDEYPAERPLRVQVRGHPSLVLKIHTCVLICRILQEVQNGKPIKASPAGYTLCGGAVSHREGAGVVLIPLSNCVFTLSILQAWRHMAGGAPSPLWSWMGQSLGSKISTGV